MKGVLIVAAALVASIATGEELSPLELLMPMPQVVEHGIGTVPRAALENIVVSHGTVPGAPVAVAAESYSLEIRPDGISITSPDSRGERYARVTLSQIEKLSGGSVPACSIRDWPVLRWRGFMNDCGRNYLDISGIKAVLDVMAAYKLNLFHWHLTDYHGWRLESRKFPSLQDRKTFLRQVGRYYTQEEFREIVGYAADRGITVMPEFDVPGHTLALRKGLGVDSMADAGVEAAVSELIEELCSLAPAETMPFVHIGTDEVRTRAEQCDVSCVTTWAKVVNDSGRKAVVWAPGKSIAPSCAVVDMVWHDNYVTNSTNPFLYADSVRMYSHSWSPFDVLSHAAFVDPRHWTSESGRQLGAVMCTWHDDNVGEETSQLFRDCMVFPSLIGFADNYWSGRSRDRIDLLSVLPKPSDSLFKEAQELENRMAIHRDVFFGDFEFPFPFVRQTDMRWRITDMSTGQVLARDVPQGTVWMTNRRCADSSFSRARDGVVSLETWIYSPQSRNVGAWIDFACYFGPYSRLGGRTPEKGEWNRAGAQVLVNGVEIPPPEWKQPGMESTTRAEREQDIPYSTDLLEKPLVDELPTLRPPTTITLKEGWNYVRIVLPKSHLWGCTFCPIDGTSDHPREVAGLKFSSEPPAWQSMKVLMIGNSFSVCNLRQMPHVALAVGARLDIASLNIGGCSLERHCANLLASTNSAFRPYRFDRMVDGVKAVENERANILDVLGLDRWDVVTIQQASHFSWRPETYDPFAGLLVAKIREVAPQAKIVVQETWSYPTWDKRLLEFGFDQSEMYRRLHAAYSGVARKYGLDVIPVGAIAETVSDRDSLFTKPDFHFNRDGEYLQGLAFVAKLLDVDVGKCPYVPEWMETARANEFMACVMNVIKGNSHEK